LGVYNHVRHLPVFGIIFWVFRNSFFKKPILRVLQKSFKCDSINKSNQLK
jgi:hypothetical protein